MNYIIEANAGIVFLYGIYLLLLGNETDFAKQRAFLLGGVICALVLPLIKIPAAVTTDVLPTIILPEVTAAAKAASSINYLLIGYLVVAIVVAAPVLINASRLYRLSKGDRGKYHGSYYIVESDEDRPSWSFFRLIYIGRANELTKEDKSLIVKHEMLHGHLLHSVDMLVITLLCIVAWFNPVVWFYRRTMAKVHEFEVDAVIARQNGAADYTMLLAKTALLRNGFQLTHHFNQSFILKRINMINTIKNRISAWKAAGLGAAVVLYFIGVACSDPMATKAIDKERPIDKSGEVYTMVDETGHPADGMTAFYSELSKRLTYPEQARTAGVEGRVFVEFIVNKGGELSDFKVVKGIDARCDKAAVDALSQMGDWVPGFLKGEPVRQKMVLPVNFKLD